MFTRPDDYFGYWLFYTSQVSAYSFAETLKACCIEHQKPYIVTPAQWNILARITWNDGMTIGTLSQTSKADAPTTTGIVKRMEQSNLVKRKHDREDRRVVKVYITDEGRDIMQYLPSAVLAANEHMMQGFTLTERETMIALMHRILANLSEPGSSVENRFGVIPDKLFTSGYSCEEIHEENL
jgi:DNA-binding MarR family transcriptional regulator